MPLKKKKKPAAKKRRSAGKKKAARPIRKKAVKRAPRKKTVVKRRSSASAAAKKAAAAAKKAREGVVGLVTHYFPHVNAAVIIMKKGLTVGEKIRIKGHTTDFTQEVRSLQIDRQPIETAKKGQEIGLMVDSRVRQHDLVYKI